MNKKNAELIKVSDLSYSVVIYYRKAKKSVIDLGYNHEVRWAEKVKFEDQTIDDFFREYVWVVCNSGMMNQIAKKIYERYMKDLDLAEIRHPHKRYSIEQLIKNGRDWFAILQAKKTDLEKIEYLQTLPHIGIITKYHLAKNLGIQVAKPDRHLVRVAEQFLYKNPQEMCEFISKHTGDNIITIDVVIWRYCNLFGSEV